VATTQSLLSVPCPKVAKTCRQSRRRGTSALVPAPDLQVSIPKEYPAARPGINAQASQASPLAAPVPAAVSASTPDIRPDHPPPACYRPTRRYGSARPRRAVSRGSWRRGLCLGRQSSQRYQGQSDALPAIRYREFSSPPPTLRPPPRACRTCASARRRLGET